MSNKLQELAILSALMASDIGTPYGCNKPHAYKAKTRSKSEKRARKLASKNRRNCRIK